MKNSRLLLSFKLSVLGEGVVSCYLCILGEKSLILLALSYQVTGVFSGE